MRDTNGRFLYLSHPISIWPFRHAVISAALRCYQLNRLQENWQLLYSHRRTSAAAAAAAGLILILILLAHGAHASSS